MAKEELTEQKKTAITTKVLNVLNQYTEEEGLQLPKNFKPTNALKSAWLILLDNKTKNGESVLTTCSPTSITNALLNMCILGVNPAKSQCYFIAYGNNLTLMTSYFGNIAILKRMDDFIGTPTAQVVYEDDIFEYGFNLDTGEKTIFKHEQKLENVDMKKITAAYAVVRLKDGSKSIEIMTIEQIRKSWNMGATKGGSKAHQEFPDEMAKRTVLNRAVKLFIKTRDDSDLLSEAIANSNISAEDFANDEIIKNANKDFIDIDVTSEELKDEPIAPINKMNFDEETGEVFPEKTDLKVPF